ncbi:MAG: hypothetical protein DRJ35_04790 [Thermoprotei archaeon]|nr:MAG: hypothetical protein DRJ35_04790 [Thermoprotei archaeon]
MRNERIVGIIILSVTVLGILLPAIIPAPRIDLSSIWFKEGFLKKLIEVNMSTVYEKSFSKEDIPSPYTLTVSVSSGTLEIKPLKDTEDVLKIVIKGKGSGYDVNVGEEGVSVSASNSLVELYVNEEYLKELRVNLQSSMGDIELDKIHYNLDISIQSSTSRLELNYVSEAVSKISVMSSFVSGEISYPKSTGVQLKVIADSSYVTLSGDASVSITSGTETYGSGGVSLEIAADSSFVSMRVTEK